MMCFCKITLIASFLLLINSFVFAQHNPLHLARIDQQGKFLASYEAVIKSATPYNLVLETTATSVVIKTDALQSFDGAYIISQGDTLYVTDDTHAQEETSQAGSSSNLVIFKSAQTQLTFYSGSVSGKVIFHLLNSGRATVNYRQGATDQAGEMCAKPLTIDQDIWRAGLPSPVQLPDATQPKHLIVHHAASSNNLTDYTYVVRNIYLQHTQVNKWNDIGYNFLIAQDGTIFQGRDGRNQIEDDNVLGAHFCGKNSGTMGVCLLGNYTSIPPTEKALVSLLSLLSWKAKKENLNPLGTTLHPKNSTNATMLDVIAGHRDGCNTECPGSFTYALLPQIRQQVSNQLNTCKGVVDQEVVVYPQPGTGDVFVKVAQGKEIQQLVLYDLTGKELSPDYKKMNIREIRLATQQLPAGLYVLRVYLPDNSFYTRKLIVF